MFIVIDTTEMFQHPLLNGPDWNFIQTLLNREPVSLVVPEIVISETINYYPIKLSDVVTESRRAIGRLNKLVPDIDVEVPVINIEHTTAQFRHRLTERLKELRALTPGFKDIEMSRVVQRSLERRKPFDAKGQRGFRDAILWETILELARTNEEQQIVLVTGNTNDFGSDGGLAPDLLTDLERMSLSSDHITICAGLHKFTESYVKPKLIRLDDLQTQIQEQTEAWGRATISNCFCMENEVKT